MSHASYVRNRQVMTKDPLALRDGTDDDTGLRGKQPRTLRHKRGYSPSEWRNVVLVVVLLLFLAITGYILFQRYERQHDESIRQEIRQKELGFLTKDLEKKFQTMESDNKQLKQQLDSAESERTNLRQKYETAEQRDTRLANENKRLMEDKLKMHEAIRKLSKQRILEKFGPGPFKVEMMLSFDPDSNVAQIESGDRIVIELAPIDDMPHSVYTFLEQVDRKLFDGCSFHRNANHVIQAGPADNYLTQTGTHLNQRFKDAGYESVLFQEYSDKWKHKQYTVGYAGRPGGPDFYISTRDNSIIHGPGGQANYDDPTEADPCFAKVVEGIDVVERIHKSSTKPGGYKHMEHNVAITQMRIIH